MTPSNVIAPDPQPSPTLGLSPDEDLRRFTPEELQNWLRWYINYANALEADKRYLQRDFQTQAHSRAAFERLAPHVMATLWETCDALANAGRVTDAQMARPTIAVGDVRGFKRVNDEYGHSVGDHALRALVLAIHGRAPHVWIARWGTGDEFIVLGSLADMATLGKEMEVAYLAQTEDANRPGTFRDVEQTLVVSFALATATDPRQTHVQLYEFADRRLMERKRARQGDPDRATSLDANARLAG